MASEIVLTMPGTGDVLRFPPFDDVDTQRRRIANLRAQAAANPVGVGPQDIPQIINYLDDAQDMLSVGLTIAAPIFRRLPPPFLPIFSGLADLSRLLNSVNMILGAVQAGRLPKRTALEDLLYASPSGPVQVEEPTLSNFQVDPLLLAGFNPIAFALTAGQVLYNLTGVGLVLGGLMQLASSPLWVGLDLAAGRHLTVVIPPPADPILKARNFLSQFGPMQGAWSIVDAADQALLAAATVAAIDVVSTAPVFPQYTPTPEQYGTTVYHYDRFRGIVQNDFEQFATPFVEYTSLLPDAAVFDPQDPWAGRFGLPVRWPWNPVSSQQLTLDPSNYLPDEVQERLSSVPPCNPAHTGSAAECSWVKFWDERQSQYIDWQRTFGPYAQHFDIRMAELAAQSATYQQLVFQMQHSVYDYSTWYNANTPLFRQLSRGESRLMAIAIEENVFPPVPPSPYTYCICSEPYDPPTRLAITGESETVIHFWFDRARYLWNNPGAPFTYPDLSVGGTVTWRDRPFPGRTTRAAALIAASYELFGARYYRPLYDSPTAPFWANWVMGSKPYGITYYEPGIGLVAGDGNLRPLLRFKTEPSNAWTDCNPPAPVPPGQCYPVVFPDGTFIIRCPPGVHPGGH